MIKIENGDYRSYCAIYQQEHCDKANTIEYRDEFGVDYDTVCMSMDCPLEDENGKRKK